MVRRGLGEATDGVVVVRPPGPDDALTLVNGRDAEFHRWLGPGAAVPSPTVCIAVGGEVVGWVDHDTDHAWLEPGEVNVGYNVFAPHRGQGYASRAVHLLLHRLAIEGRHRTATLLIEPGNERSLALAARTRFTRVGEVDGSVYFKRPVPPLSYTDGVVTIRRPRPDDLDADLEAKDDAQIRWLWLPGQRRQWESMTPGQQRDHVLAGLQANHDAFGHGPKWTFAVDLAGTSYVAYVDCDLANDSAPAGEANISYSSHPGHRGKGYASRAVRLVTRFLADHTGARRAHVIVDARNTPSLRVAAAVGARPVDQWTNTLGAPMIRHVLDL